MVGAPTQLEDVWKRDLFLTCLHKNLKEHYENMIALRPSTTFNEVMEDMEKAFGMDNPHYFRQHWENVKLKFEGKLTLAEFLLWKSRYLTARSLVQDFTDQEDMDMVLKNLPQVWREKVLQQEAKEAERRWIVKIVGSTASEESLKKSFAGALGEVVSAKKLRGAHLMEFKTEDQKSKALSFKNITLGNDELLTMTPVRRARWTTEKVFDYMVKQLRIEQESKLLLDGATSSNKEWRPRIEGGGKG